MVVRSSLNFTVENSKIAFCATLWGGLGVTYTVYLWFVGKRVVDFLLLLIMAAEGKVIIFYHCNLFFISSA